MKLQSQLKVTGTKAFACKAQIRKLSELLQGQCPENIEDLKVMHSQTLHSISGLSKFQQIKKLNLSSNAIESIMEISQLTHLEQLDIRANRIKSLQGIEKCLMVIKLDASHNQINSLQIFRMMHASRLQYINLAGNQLSDVQNLQNLLKLQHLKQLTFEKGKASNPMCQNKYPYWLAIQKYLKMLEVVDSRSIKQIRKELVQHKNNQQSHQESIKPSYQISSQYQAYRFTHPNIIQQPIYQAPKKQTIKAKEIQTILRYKEECIEDLKEKSKRLQLTNSEHYRTLIKKQTEMERLYQQVTDLSKQVQSKDQRLSESHKRVQDLLKVSGQNSKFLEVKRQQVDKLNKDINELKIQNAQYKALSKDYERRLSQMHLKTLHNVEDRAIKNQEIKRKLETTYDQNRTLQREQQQLKDRVRQLTHLLRQWQYKYESKVNEIETKNNYEKAQLIRQADCKITENNQNLESEFEKMQLQMRQKMQQMQLQYKQALDNTVEKCRNLKRLYEQKYRQQENTKIILKTVMQKTKEQESILQQFQTISVKLKAELEDNRQQKQQREKEIVTLRNKSTEQFKSMQEEINKLNYEKSTLDKRLKELKNNNQMYIVQAERYQQKEHNYQQMQNKIEHLITSLDAKNVMLDDKNETIDTLKADLDMMRKDLQNKVDVEQLNGLRRKYDKNKQQLKEFSEQVEGLMQQNEEMKDRILTYEALEGQFSQVKDILSQQDNTLAQKDKQIQQLIKLLQDCKRVNLLQKQELDQLKRELQRQNKQHNEKEKAYHRKLHDLEQQYTSKLNKLEQQRDTYKQKAAMELENLAKKFKL